MMEELKKQKQNVSMMIALLKKENTLENRIKLSEELIKFDKLRKIDDKTLMDIRKIFELKSAIWITAELRLQEDNS
ncbi:MAG: hypothetical protein PUE12_00280 [Oscillospiraceae bacterium]|nr:hypothetical protein [Oscillospiraceae bacterium]